MSSVIAWEASQIGCLLGGRHLPRKACCLAKHATCPGTWLQEALTPEEQLSLIRSAPAAASVSSLLAPAFREMRPLARHQLLGARLSLEGLFRVTRDPGGSVYELRLGC